MADPQDISTSSRIAVFRPGEADKPFCIASLESSGDIKVSCSDAAGASALGSLLDASVGTVPASEPDVGAARWLALRRALEAAGYTVRDLPAADVQMQVTFDLSTGRVVGSSSALHPYSDTGAAVAESVFARLRGIPATLLGELERIVRDRVAGGDHQAAAAALLEFRSQGNFVLGIHPKAIKIAREIDVQKIDPASKTALLELRVGLAGAADDYGDATGADVSALKEDHAWSTLDAETRSMVLMAEGCVAARAGKRELAYALWRTVLVDPPGPEARAWAYKNLSSILTNDNPQAAEFAQLASDAFLEAGDQVGAAKSALHHAHCILAAAPGEALRVVDEAASWFTGESPPARDARGGLLHAKADALLRLGRAMDALQSALAAADSLAQLHGAEEGAAASLLLAAHAARQAGLEADASRYESRADALIGALPHPGAALQRAASRLATNFDQAQADLLLAEARLQEQKRTEALLLLTIAIHSSKAHVDRLRLLEDALVILRENGVRADVEVALSTLGGQLLEAKEYDRAIPVYREALSLDPLNHVSRQNYAALLWKLKRWPEAVRFFEDQLETFGALPGVLYGYGRSLLASGDLSRAATYLYRAKAAAGADSSLRDRAERLLASAFAGGAQLSPQVDSEANQRPVSRAEFEACLREFSTFIKAEKRMTLWQPDGSGSHKWRSGPEKHAQNLLHTFLKGHFGRRVEAFEELDVGAGRLDLYCRCAGGLSVIIELKMLGAPYTTTYAFAGNEQIAHYMDNKNVHLGYLVLLDGRARDYGTGLGETVSVGAFIVRTLFVDVRPSVRGPPG